MSHRKIIVNVATTADGYLARPDGNLDWLTERPVPKDFYGLLEFERSTDAKILGRKTFDQSLAMGAHFRTDDVRYVFSRRLSPTAVPAGVHFVNDSIHAFVRRLRTQAGKDVWLMGGGEIIGSLLDEGVIDEFIITVVPIFIGEGIPLLVRRHRKVELGLIGVRQFPDGVVQLRYQVRPQSKGPNYRQPSVTSGNVRLGDDRAIERRAGLSCLQNVPVNTPSGDHPRCRQHRLREGEASLLMLQAEVLPDRCGGGTQSHTHTCDGSAPRHAPAEDLHEAS
jgi:dihydrofolate reductase